PGHATGQALIDQHLLRRGRRALGKPGRHVQCCRQQRELTHGRLELLGCGCYLAAIGDDLGDRLRIDLTEHLLAQLQVSLTPFGGIRLAQAALQLVEFDQLRGEPAIGCARQHGGIDVYSPLRIGRQQQRQQALHDKHLALVTLRTAMQGWRVQRLAVRRRPLPVTGQLSRLEDVLGHPCAGASWEGCVLENLMVGLPADAVPYFYRTAAGAEIDLVIERGTHQRLAIEIKRSLAPTLSKGFHQGCADIEATERCLVYPGTESFPVSGGAWAVSVTQMRQKLVTA
ncbi:MAG: DUF4143 domain-containing protein, partial [Deltaproteobacteria bacterium]